MKIFKHLFTENTAVIGMALGVFLGPIVLPAVDAQLQPNADEAEQAAQTDATDVEGRAYQPERPANLPDLTKGERIPVPEKGGPITWNMGPTGVIGIKNGGFKGDQVRVVAVLPGSPAEGKILPGDVILGVQGEDFAAGGHLGLTVGNAIIKAEEEAGQGIFKMHLWRDRNWIKRGAPKDMLGTDLEELFRKAEEDADLYEWQGDEQQTAAVKQMAYDEFPIDGVHLDVTLQLEVMGTYSETSPWDCPVAKHVRENAWKVLAARFKPDKRGRTHADWPSAIALVASGRPEYIDLVRAWVHSKKFHHDMAAKVSLDDLTHRGMQSWFHGFGPLEMAIYYDATHDDFVLPEVRYQAIMTALGQNGGGSWGHTFSFPESNGGMLHMHNPGYGAMNNAGTRCFFLLTLAKKAGIEDPEIDAAIARASRFFGTFVDKGCIPYGYHPPAASDDSNGKNYGAAYAFYVLGDVYKAKYFSMHSNHASFSRRGGHGSPTLWYYTPLSANICGPRGVIASMRNMRWFYTLSRRHDGSFVFQGEQAGIGGKGMRNPTATLALFYSAPLKQLVITGKDPNRSCWFTDEELEELLISARGTRKRGQITDPVLLEKIGKPWNERGTDELIGLLDHFYPNMRRALAGELAKRFAAGEQDIVAKVLPMLTSDEARMRDGACRTLSACGTDTVLASLSKITPLLDDSAEFVRMTAIAAIAKATQPGDRNRELLMLQAAADAYEHMSMDNANVRTAVRNAVFPGGRHGSGATGSKLSTEPFQAGYDRELVRAALERIVTMDPGGMVPRSWSKETLLRLAGPIAYVADEMQLNDAMFGFARTAQGRALLRKFGYREAVEGDVTNLLKRHELERRMRLRMRFKMPYITPKAVKQAPGLYREFLDQLHLWLQDDPVCVLSESNGKGKPPTLTPLDELIEMIEKDNTAKPMPSIAAEVTAMFQGGLAAAGGTDAKLTLCRKELKDPGRKNYFRKMAAMSQLVEMLGFEAIDDVAPYLGHEHWRVRNHAQRLAVELIKGGAAARLIALFRDAKGENGAGMLYSLAAAVARDDAAAPPPGAPQQPKYEGGSAWISSALEAAKNALQRQDPIVRRAAVQAVMTLGGDDALPEVLAFMRQTSDPDDLWGCELALLSRCGKAAFARRVRDEAIAWLPKSNVQQRRSLAWVLGQIGGAESLAAIQKAAATTDDEADLKEMVMALAYSPDRAADSTMLELAKMDEQRRDVVAALSVHRMVGRNGVRDVTDKERVAFARGVLNLKYNNRLITYLGKVHTGPSVQLLFDVMKKGRDSTGVAAKGIITCVEGMENPPKADAKIAADVMAEVIEYIEITKLRGGVSSHMGSKEAIAAYATWVVLQARAGKALLKVHKPETAPIPEFDDSDLDL